MPLDGQGTASRLAGSVVFPNTTILSVRYNSDLDDIYSVMSQALYADGRRIASGDLAFAPTKTVIAGRRGLGDEVAQAKQIAELTTLPINTNPDSMTTGGRYSVSNPVGLPTGGTWRIDVSLTDQDPDSVFQTATRIEGNDSISIYHRRKTFIGQWSSWVEIASGAKVFNVDGHKLAVDANDTNAFQRACTAAGPTNGVVWTDRWLTVSGPTTIQPAASGISIINNPIIMGANPRTSGLKRAVNYNGDLLRIGYLDTNATSGTSFRPGQTRIIGMGFDGNGNGTEVTGISLNIIDGNVTAPNIGYGYAPFVQDCYFEGGPEQQIYCGLYRNFGYFDRVIAIYAKKQSLWFNGNGDHDLVACSVGEIQTANVDAALFQSVFSTMLFGCDFHGAVQRNLASVVTGGGSGVAVTGAGSYMTFVGGAMNDNAHNGIRVFGGAALQDRPIIIDGVLFSRNSALSNGTYQNIAISDRSGVVILHPKYQPSGIANLPGYHVGVSGACGDVFYEAVSHPAGCVSINVTNDPLSLTGSGQATTVALTQANVTSAGAGTLTAGNGTMTVIRTGWTIKGHVNFTVVTNGTASTGLLFPSPKGVPLMTSYGSGRATGNSNGLVNIQCPAGIATFDMRQLIQPSGGMGYPAANGVVFDFSFQYDLARAA